LVVTRIPNLVGGGLLVLPTVGGALPEDAAHSLSRVAEEIAAPGLGRQS
jgi:hypothetical protein